jgi:flagellar biosynthesis/type III secretory pathway chaperone
MSDESISALLDSINALIAVMEEESETLALYGPRTGIAELGAAKTRLVARMEGQLAKLNRDNPAWHRDMDSEIRDELTAAYNDMHNASVINSAILERQIDLSSEMLAAVGLEIERLTGRGATTYGSGGKVKTARGRPPLSINTQL